MSGEPIFVVAHDCHADLESFVVIGPFADRDAAWIFVERHGLESPRDGGYAFAALTPPLPGEHGNPTQWDAELAEMLGDDEP